MKRIIGLAALAIILLSPLSIWASGEQAAGSQSAPAAAPAAGPITLRFAWWGAEARHNATLQNLTAYERLNPNIKFEPEYGAYGGFLEKLYVQLNSRTAPDLPSVDGKWVPDMMRNYRDSFKNLRETVVDLSGFDQEFLRLICGDANYTLGVSMGSNTYGAIYSPAFFTKFGLGDPANWGWEDYVEAGKKIQAQDKESFLLCNVMNNYAYTFKWYLKQITGKDIVSDDNTIQFTEAEAERTWQHIADLIQFGGVPPLEESMPYATNYPNENPKWLQGKYGMSITQISNLSGIINGTPYELKTASLPIHPGAKDIGWPVSSSMVIGVYAYGKNQEEAAKFLNWYINDPNAILTTGDTRGLPSNLRAAKLLGDNKKLMPQMVEFAEKYSKQGSSVENNATIDPKIIDLCNEFAQQVGYKRMTPRQAAVNFRTELQNLLTGIR